MKSESESPRTSSHDCVRTASVQTHASSRRGMLPYGNLLPSHEADIGFRFARLYELIDLVKLREVPRRSSCGHGQVEGEIADVNKPAAFLLFVCAHRSYTAFHARDPFRVCSSRT